MINYDHIEIFDLAERDEVKEMEEVGMEVNRVLSRFFDERGITLVDFKLEFGRHKGEVLLGDEITPDGCRLWDKETNEKMDKDRFRRDLGKIEEAYQEVAGRCSLQQGERQGVTDEGEGLYYVEKRGPRPAG